MAVRKYDCKEEDLKRLSRFRLLDDDFMSKVFEDNIAGVQLLLNIILNRTDIEVKCVSPQKETKSITSHAVRFDVYAEDANGKKYDIEIQRSDKGASPQRARYNSSMLDTRCLEKGKSYSEMCESYVIFITERDVLKKGLPLYHIERKITEIDEFFSDGSHIIFVNGEYKDNTNDIGKLMHDFRCTNADDMNFPELSNKVRFLKETEGGAGSMCKMMEDMRNEAAKNKAIEFALSMLKDNFTLEQIAKHSGLSLEEIEKLKKENNL